MEYDTFVENLQALPQGKETELVIRELAPGQRKYCRRRVKAVITNAAQGPAGGDVLWLRFYSGRRHPQPWAIKITEELG
jgi:hypothetical protein